MPKVPTIKATTGETTTTRTSVVPKTRKSRSPKQEQQKVRETAAIVLKPFFKLPGLPKQGEEGFGWAQELHAAGYPEEAIANDLAAKEVKFDAESAEIERKANTPDLPYTSEKQQAEKKEKQAENFAKLKAAQPAKPEPTQVANTQGIDVTKTDGGRYLIYGQPTTGIFRYCGSAAWTHEEAMALLKSLGITDVSESTARIQMGAGKKGGDCGGRGPIPTLTAEQVTKLEAAGGRVVIATPVEVAKKTRKAK